MADDDKNTGESNAEAGKPVSDDARTEREEHAVADDAGITEKIVSALVEETEPDVALEGCYGPYRIAGRVVWEVWVHDGDEYITRFVVSGRNGGPRYHRSFGELCAYVSLIHERQEDAIGVLSDVRHATKVRLYVAASTFIAAVGVLLYLVATSAETNLSTFAVLASLIASGGAMFYGAWLQMQVPGTINKVGKSPNS